MRLTGLLAGTVAGCICYFIGVFAKAEGAASNSFTIALFAATCAALAAMPFLQARPSGLEIDQSATTHLLKWVCIYASGVGIWASVAAGLGWAMNIFPEDGYQLPTFATVVFLVSACILIASLTGLPTVDVRIGSLSPEAIRKTHEQETAKAVALVCELEARGDRDGALTAVAKYPWSFSKLPEHFRDSEEFALAVMKRHPFASDFASARLKSDIDFFVKAFNEHEFSVERISLSSACDLLVMLDYAKTHRGFHHTISETDVFQRFACSPEAVAAEASAAKRLVALSRTDEALSMANETAAVQKLAAQVPGFADFSYRYAWRQAIEQQRQRHWR